jgi:hypothetical protein
MPRPSSSLSAVMLALDRAKDFTRQAKKTEAKLRKQIADLERQIDRLQAPTVLGEEN